MTTIDNITETTRRGVCLAMAAAIVALTLTLTSLGADAAFADAYAASKAQVYVVQLA